MWFATPSGVPDGLQPPALGVAIPLRGYVVCNIIYVSGIVAANAGSRNPLTELCRLQLVVEEISDKSTPMSQSPYGAMSFATRREDYTLAALVAALQSPYGAMSFATKVKVAEGASVLMSQSPYGAMSFATWRGRGRWGGWPRPWSQSPYGAMSFATPKTTDSPGA